MHLQPRCLRSTGVWCGPRCVESFTEMCETPTTNRPLGNRRLPRGGGRRLPSGGGGGGGGLARPSRVELDVGVELDVYSYSYFYTCKFCWRNHPCARMCLHCARADVPGRGERHMDVCQNTCVLSHIHAKTHVFWHASMCLQCARADVPSRGVSRRGRPPPRRLYLPHSPKIK